VPVPEPLAISGASAWFSSRGGSCYEHPLNVSACSDRLAARVLVTSLGHAVAAPATLHYPPAWSL
jgi:hypothetical protein